MDQKVQPHTLSGTFIFPREFDPQPAYGAVFPQKEKENVQLARKNLNQAKMEKKRPFFNLASH